MSIQTRLRDTAASLQTTYSTVEYTEALANSLNLHGRDFLTIKPPRESDGLKASQALVSAFYHDTSLGTSSPTYSLTPAYHDGRIHIYASAPDGRASDIRDTVTNAYPGASVAQSATTLPIGEGQYVAGAKLRTQKDCLFPLQTRASSEALETDPFTAILPRMVGDDDEVACLQAVFTSAPERWFSRGLVGSSGERVASALTDGIAVGELDPQVITTDQATRASKDIGRQHGRDAFRVDLRVLTAADSRQTASRRLERIVANLNCVSNPDTEQKLVPVSQSGQSLRALIQTVGGRWPDHRNRLWDALTGPANILTDQELGDFLVHLPTADDVQAPLEWAEQTTSERIPPDAY
jgi:hypothetical protein